MSTDRAEGPHAPAARRCRRADLTGVVLAGGHSSRFGEGNKATARLDGEPLAGRAVAAVSAVTDGPPLVAVQTRAQRDELAPALDRPVEFVRDADGFTGPLAGLVAAARAADTARLAVVGCDMPLVSPVALRWLADRADPTTAVVPVDADGEEQLLHALYPTAPIATDPPATTRLRTLSTRLPSTTVPVGETPPGVDMGRSLTNVNTRADLDVARARR